MTTVDELVAEHSGVKGMHWGQRKAAPPVKPSTDFKKSRELKERHPASLSSKQLKTVNERLQLEQKYSQLTPKKNVIMTNKVKAFLGVTGLAVLAYSQATSPAGKAAIARGKQLYKAASTVKAGPLKPGEVINFTTKTASAWPKVL